MLLEEELVEVVCDTEAAVDELFAELLRISKNLLEGTNVTNEEVDVTAGAKVSVSVVLSNQLREANIPTS